MLDPGEGENLLGLRKAKGNVEKRFALEGGRWRIAVTYSLKGLRQGTPDGQDLVVFDNLGAGDGSQIGLSEGVEAAMPFFPEKKPLDAYCACILDQVNLHSDTED